MSETINVYCDESCHLNNPHIPVMVIGGVWCSKRKAHETSKRLRELKLEYGLRTDNELKWVHVSPAKLDYYRAVVELFCADPELHFRAVIIPDRRLLDHQKFEQTPEDFYYKVYYLLLHPILSSDVPYKAPGDAVYRVFIDYKDNLCSRHALDLANVLRRKLDDSPPYKLKLIQAVKSHEVEMIQLTDLLIGAVAYANRGLSSSTAKMSLVDQIRDATGQSLVVSTPLRQNKINVFRWTPSEVRD